MFERYTEPARRAVFRSRFEAGASGSREIEPGHLLLGILREATDLAGALIGDGERLAEFLGQIERRYPKSTAKVSATGGDMPLSDECKRALAFAAKEAEHLNQREIGPEHLLLGLLRVNVPPADALAEYGVTPGSVRQHALRHAPAHVTEPIPKPAGPRVALHELVERLPEDRWGAAARLIQALCEQRVEVSGTDSQGSFSIRYGVQGDQRPE